MNADPRNVIVAELPCTACSTDTVSVHHQSFPETQVGGSSVSEAAERLANQLENGLDVVTDPTHRDPIRQAIADIQAFLEEKEQAHLGQNG